MPSAELRLATRRSELATAQTRRVAELLESVNDALRVTLVPVTSSGDRDRRAPIASLTERGAFVRSLQRAVLEGAADAAVHSCKDLPTAGPEELVVAAYPERGSPFDVLVGAALAELPDGARVGTGSPRRVAQLRLLLPGVRTVGLRGNVPTRLRRVARGEVDAAVLAEAGLERLGRREVIAHRFSLEEMVPAPAQGVLAVETRRTGLVRELVEAIDDEGVRRLVECERELLAETGAGCRAALGAYAERSERGIRMTAFVADEAGPRRTVAEEAEPWALVAAVRKELGL